MPHLLPCNRMALSSPHARSAGTVPLPLATVDGRPAAFFDGPGGTQTPRGSSRRWAAYLSRDNSNLGGAFLTSRRTDEMVAAARQEMARFLNAAGPGGNRLRSEHDEPVLRLEPRAGPHVACGRRGDRHVAGSRRKRRALAPRRRDAGADRPHLGGAPGGLHARLADLEPLLNERTRLVAITHASNAVGTIPDVARRDPAGARQARRRDGVHRRGSLRAAWDDRRAGARLRFPRVARPTSSVARIWGSCTENTAHLDRLEAYKVRPSSQQTARQVGNRHAELREHRRACAATSPISDRSARERPVRGGDGCDPGITRWLDAARSSPARRTFPDCDLRNDRPVARRPNARRRSA